MNSVSKKEQFNSHGYNWSEKEEKIIKANLSRIVKSVPAFDARRAIGLSLMKAIRTLGQKNFSDSDVRFTESGIYEWFLRQRETIKIDEIILSIDLGSCGDFSENGNDVLYVSVKNCVGWIKSYQKSKLKVLQALSAAKEKEALRTSLNESKKKDLEYWGKFPHILNWEFCFYKVKGVLSESGWRVVKNLEVIEYNDFKDLPDEDKRAIYKEEKANVTRQSRVKLNERNGAVFDEIQRINKINNDALSLSKQRALCIWFDKIDRIDVEKVEGIIKELVNKYINKQ